VLYVFFGADEFACAEALQELQDGLVKAGLWSDPSMGELNRSILDGQRLTISELHHHCDAIPFLAERRLVIVEKLVTRLEGKGGARSAADEPAEAQPAEQLEKAKGLLDELLAYLPNLPDTTDLVLLDAGLQARDSRGRIARWAQGRGAAAVVREFPAKKPEELAGWIKERVQAAGASIDPRAVAELAALVGDDMRQLAQEVEKLALYADAGQTITAEDVGRLVPHSREANIFAIVDAIGERRWARAIAELRRLLEEGVHPLSVEAMIARQYRLIIEAKSWAAAGLPPAELPRRLGVGEYPARKALQQAGRYTPAQLRSAYDRLVETDLAIKTGQMDAALALEMFVAGGETTLSP